MTKDDILQALRLTAMGRAGHPLQEQLADKLVECFAAHAPKAAPVDLSPPLAQFLPTQPLVSAVATIPVPVGTPDPIQAIKRGPGRPKKAD